MVTFYYVDELSTEALLKLTEFVWKRFPEDGRVEAYDSAWTLASYGGGQLRGKIVKPLLTKGAMPAQIKPMTTAEARRLCKSILGDEDDVRAGKFPVAITAELVLKLVLFVLKHAFGIG